MYKSIHFSLSTTNLFVRPLPIYPFSILIPCIYASSIHKPCFHPSVFSIIIFLFIHPLSTHSSVHYLSIYSPYIPHLSIHPLILLLFYSIHLAVYPLFIHPCIYSSILLLTLHLSSNFKLFINPHPSSIYHLFTFYQSPVHPFLHLLSTHPFLSNHPFIHHLSTLLPPIL